MKIYMVEASWYDHMYEENCLQNIVAFTSKESAQKYIDAFPEINEAAGRRVQELTDKGEYEGGQAIDDDELMNAMKEHVYIYGVPDNEVDLRISEYELRD